MTEYQYQTLQETQIRLLDLAPGHRGSPLCGKLIQSPINRPEAQIQSEDRSEEESTSPERKTYVAISYCWGSDSKPHILNTPSGQIPITQSLWTALNRIRTIVGAGLYWADAICINQKNNEEKCEQIALMKEIYSKAQYVIVDLGDEADGSQLVEEYARRIASAGKTREEKRERTSFFGLPHDIHRAVSDGDASWQAFQDLLHRPWFCRTWVIQELCLAREVKVICGDWIMDWEVLYAAILNFRSYNSDNQANLRGYNGKQQMIWYLKARSAGELGRMRRSIQRGSVVDYLELLDIFKTSRTTRARDKMFGLLPLLKREYYMGFTPSYDEPLEKVVIRFAHEFISTGYGPAMLGKAGLQSQPDRFPSWVPDWVCNEPDSKVNHGRGIFAFTDCDKLNVELELVRQSGYKGEHAARNSKGSQKLKDAVYYKTSVDRVDIIGVYDPNQNLNSSKASGNTLFVSNVANDQLTVRGGPIDRVKHVLKLNNLDHRNGWVPNIYSAHILRLARMRELLKGIEHYPTGQRTESAIWLTLIGNNDSDLDPKLRKKWAARSCGEKLQVWEDFLWESMTTDKKDENLLAGSAFDEIVSWSPLLLTEKGYFGLGPIQSRIGDEIAVFAGCGIPFVVRDSETREGVNRLVGNCYVHGMMKGETLDADFFAENIITLH